MKLAWANKALSDLERLHNLLAPTNRQASDQALLALAKASSVLLTNPRVGEQLFQFEPCEVRRLLTAQYEIRYEIQGETVYVLRLWHAREDR
ncbi:MAG: type II toxin-antitoxin system RelE/ParE family toxin [Burkholderiales bacterium]|jgi:plasmid stabilization system protein ParE|nr:type II toxin-antitoxin system RelE/ParE family toxin [Burkholderiales bacterium]